MVIKKPVEYDADALRSLLQSFVALLLIILNVLFCGVVFSGNIGGNVFYEVNDIRYKYEFDLELKDKSDVIIQALQNEISFVDEAKLIKSLGLSRQEIKENRKYLIGIKIDDNYTISIDVV
jgi:hypothetical protein